MSGPHRGASGEPNAGQRLAWFIGGGSIVACPHTVTLRARRHDALLDAVLSPQVEWAWPGGDCQRRAPRPMTVHPRTGLGGTQAQLSNGPIDARSRRSFAMAWSELIVACSDCGRENGFRLPQDSWPLVCRWCKADIEAVRFRQCDGYFYVMSNPTMPNVYLLGSTQGSVEERLGELSNAPGVPAPFVLEAYFSTPSSKESTERIYETLQACRLRGKDFFEVSLDTALAVICRITQGSPVFLRDSVPLGVY